MKKIAIHGLGYLGCINLSYLVGRYYHCVAYDYNKGGTRRNKKNLPLIFSDFFDDLFLSKNLMIGKKDLFEIVDSPEMLFQEDVGTHIICVPTEQGETPNLELLNAVLKEFYNLKKINNTINVIVESTLYPDIINNVILKKLDSLGLKLDKDYYLSVAVRQDWVKNEIDFSRQPKKVLSAVNGKSLEKVIQFYVETGQDFIVSEDLKAVEILKHVENSLTQIRQSYANQLSLAYQHIDTNELFRIVNDHIGIQLKSDIGIGGFATPLSIAVLLENAEFEDSLTILREALIIDLSMINYIVEDLKINEIHSVALLGISSDPNNKQLVFSPYVRLAKTLDENGIKVKALDPFFTSEEIAETSQCEPLLDIYDLGDLEGVIMGTRHEWSKFVDCDRFVSSLRYIKYFLDNGKFEKLNKSIKNYKTVGQRNWLRNNKA